MTAKRKTKPVTTGPGFVAWIARNVPQNKRPGQTALEAACWYWAMQEAEVLIGETLRGVAQHLLTPHPGYTKTAHVSEQLDGAEDDEEDIVDAMCNFWGVNPRG